MTSAPPKVAVVGGGPAGLATALALLGERYAVTVIESSDYTGVRVGEHLLPAAIPSLRQLQVPEEVFAGGHRRCHGIRSAWGEARLADSSYLMSPHGDGINLSRPAFDAALARLAHQRGASVLVDSRMRDLVRRRDRWQLGLSTPAGTSTVAADFVVDASGRAATAARKLGRKVIFHDKLVGIVAFLRPAVRAGAETDESLLLEATEHGWWYSSHLEDGRIVGTYMTDSDLEFGQPVDIWRRRLADAGFVRERLGQRVRPDRVEVRSARTQRLDRMAGAGWLAVGDAAMSFDPLSSQGIAKGLEDGIRAARAIRDHLGGDADVPARWNDGRMRAFRSYLRTRTEVYRTETRWPDSAFWRRRQEPMPWEQPITLDPRAELRSSRFGLERGAIEELERRLPGIDLDLLCELARSPQPAHRIVACYQSRAERLQGDRDVIYGLQQLIAADAVRVVDRPGRGSGPAVLGDGLDVDQSAGHLK